MHPEVIKRLREVAANPGASQAVRDRARRAADALERQLEGEQARLATGGVRESHDGPPRTGWLARSKSPPNPVEASSIK